MNFLPFRFDKRQSLRSPAESSRSDSGRGTSSGSLEKQVGSMIQSERATSVVHWDGGQATLNLSMQRIRSWSHAHDLGRQLSNLLEDNDVRVLRVDLRSIDRISSETLAQLSRVHCRASQMDKLLILENVTEPVAEVLRVTRLDRLFGLLDKSS